MTLGDLWGVGDMASAVCSLWFGLSWMPPSDPLCADLGKDRAVPPARNVFSGKDAV